MEPTPLQRTNAAVKGGSLADVSRLMAENPGIVHEFGTSLLKTAAENNQVHGGIGMVYFNPSGAYVGQMPDALETIGLPTAAEALRSINSLFPGGAPAPDDDIREEQLKHLPAAADELFQAFEQIFQQRDEAKQELVVLKKLQQYYVS